VTAVSISRVLQADYSVNHRREEGKSQAAHNAANSEDTKQDNVEEGISITKTSDLHEKTECAINLAMT
jgi:hypothetical protein